MSCGCYQSWLVEWIVVVVVVAAVVVMVEVVVVFVAVEGCDTVLC